MKQTSLDINGPILDFPGTTEEIIVNPGASASFTVGLASAYFPTQDPPNIFSTNTGIITYRWNAVGYGELSDGDFLGATLTGTATSTLTISNVQTPTTSGIQFFATADYIPSAYQTTPPVNAGTARSTGNAINEPKSAGINTLRVYPEIEIISQPTDRNVKLNQNATFTVNATLTDEYFLIDGPLTYQWLVNGVAVDDGTQVISSGPRSVTVNEPVTVNRTFTSPGGESLPGSSTNISLTVAGAVGGAGGSDGGGITGFAISPGGSGGSGALGRFTMPNGPKSLSFSIGRRGNNGANLAASSGGGPGGPGAASGGRGGNSGPIGWSGGGGGGGGASSVSLNGSTIIVAGGGGGGGGGSVNAPLRPINNGFSATSWNPESSISLFSGGSGFAAGADGGGGGGGGGGSLSPQPGGFGGEDGEDKGFGGDNGESSWNPSSANRQSTGTNSGDGYATLQYKYVSSSTVIIPGENQNLVISGSKTPTLTLNADYSTSRTVQCRVSHPTAVNSPVLSDLVEFASLSTAEQFNLVIEEINTTSSANVSTFDIFGSDKEFLKSASENLTSYYSLYCPDRDIAIEMDLFGGKGANNGSFSGGEGGFARIRFTMLRNTEYVISGLTPSVNTPFIYRKGQLIACVGKGGDAGTTANGGFGGGIGIAGANGNGRNGGTGGAFIATGTLSEVGIFGSLTTRVPVAPDTKSTAPNGGRTLKCARGVYWREQGFSACSDVGTTRFRLSNGTEVTNTASIARGYKAGYDIIQTAGDGLTNGGDGGCGATGGAGGTGGSGGGGGSGYTDGSVTIVSTQLGGSTGDARVIIRRAI
jgi:hypothetical protein